MAGGCKRRSARQVSVRTRPIAFAGRIRSMVCRRLQAYRQDTRLPETAIGVGHGAVVNTRRMRCNAAPAAGMWLDRCEGGVCILCAVPTAASGVKGCPFLPNARAFRASRGSLMESRSPPVPSTPEPVSCCLCRRRRSPSCHHLGRIAVVPSLWCYNGSPGRT